MMNNETNNKPNNDIKNDEINTNLDNNINKSERHEQESNVVTSSNDSIQSKMNYDIHQAILLEISLTNGNLEIPLEYYEEEEETIENTESNKQQETNTELPSSPKEPQSDSSDNFSKTQEPNPNKKPKTKTKIKTVIRKVPKIEYIEKPKVVINKLISPSISIEIFLKQPNLSLRRGQSMTLEFATSSNNNDNITKVIDEKPAEIPPIENLQEQNKMPKNEFEIKITDSTANSILTKPLDTDLSVLYKKFQDQKQFNKSHLSRRTIESPSQIQTGYRIINQPNDLSNDSPVPPPNSPNLTYSDATTLTDKELIESLNFIPKNKKKTPISFISYMPSKHP